MAAWELRIQPIEVRFPVDSAAHTVTQQSLWQARKTVGHVPGGLHGRAGRSLGQGQNPTAPFLTASTLCHVASAPIGSCACCPQDVSSTLDYDTLGAKSLALARREGERVARNSRIPGPAPLELIVPSARPIGKRLLETMGWREGTGVGPRKARRGNEVQVAEVQDLPYAAVKAVRESHQDVLKVGLIG